MKRKLLLFFLFFAIWLMWSGYYTPLLITFGLLSCAFVMWLSYRADLLDDEGAPIHITWRMLKYLPWLFKEVVKSNLDIARCVLGGNRSINQQWVITEGLQQSEVGFVVFANSITLTPGTTTVDLQGRALLVHAIHDTSAAGLRSNEMNQRVAAVEGTD